MRKGCFVRMVSGFRHTMHTSLPSTFMYTSEHQNRHISGRAMALLGLGAAAGAIGTYLYKKPRLRTRIWHAGSVGKAAKLLTTEIQHDSKEMADTMMSNVSQGVADSLRKTQRALGLRFHRRNTPARAAKTVARQARTEVRHLKETAKTDAKHTAETAKNDLRHAADKAHEAGHRVLDRAATAA